MIREITTYPNKEIREFSSSIRRNSPLDLKQLIEEMIETMKAYNGVGLAAPQVGVRKRLIIVAEESVSGDDILPLINPQIKVIGNEMIKSEEGCLSVPGPTATISRFNRIVVTGKYPSIVDDKIIMVPYQELFSGFPATIFQHEVDHLDGILFFDHLKPIANNLYVKKMDKQIKKGQAWRYQVATSL